MNCNKELNCVQILNQNNMEAYLILYWLANGKPDRMIVSASSKQEALKIADKHPKIVYYCDTLESWEKYRQEARGNFK